MPVGHLPPFFALRIDSFYDCTMERFIFSLDSEFTVRHGKPCLVAVEVGQRHSNHHVRLKPAR